MFRCQDFIHTFFLATFNGTARACRIDPKILASSRCSEASLAPGHPAEPSVTSRRPAGARGHRFSRLLHGCKALDAGFPAPRCSHVESQR